MPWQWMPSTRRRRSTRARQYRRATRYRNNDFDGGMDDDFDGDTRISVVDQRGRPVRAAVQIQGQTVRDMQPPYEDRSIYANTRRRSRF